MKIEFKNINHRRDYLSVDKQVAINTLGEIFEIGDSVKNQSEEDTIAIIESFSLDESTLDVKAFTDKGWSRISFLYKTK